MKKQIEKAFNSKTKHVIKENASVKNQKHVKVN